MLGVVDMFGGLFYGLGEEFGVVVLCGWRLVGLLMQHTTVSFGKKEEGLLRRGSRGEREVASLVWCVWGKFLSWDGW